METRWARPGLVLLAGAAVTMAACSTTSHEGAPVGTKIYPADLRLTGAVQRTITKAEQNCWTKEGYVQRGGIELVTTEWAAGKPVTKLQVLQNKKTDPVRVELETGGRTYTGMQGVRLDTKNRKGTLDSDMTWTDIDKKRYVVHVSGTIKCKDENPR
ncbi:hypothetical protein [Actinomadura macrotermitis]|nr:hypothetical protein [Actinomadura macrotermitis]